MLLKTKDRIFYPTMCMITRYLARLSHDVDDGQRLARCQVSKAASRIGTAGSRKGDIEGQAWPGFVRAIGHPNFLQKKKFFWPTLECY